MNVYKQVPQWLNDFVSGKEEKKVEAKKEVVPTKTSIKKTALVKTVVEVPLPSYKYLLPIKNAHIANDCTSYARIGNYIIAFWKLAKLKSGQHFANVVTVEEMPDEPMVAVELDDENEMVNFIRSIQPLESQGKSIIQNVFFDTVEDMLKYQQSVQGLPSKQEVAPLPKPLPKKTPLAEERVPGPTLPPEETFPKETKAPELLTPGVPEGMQGVTSGSLKKEAIHDELYDVLEEVKKEKPKMYEYLKDKFYKHLKPWVEEKEKEGGNVTTPGTGPTGEPGSTGEPGIFGTPGYVGEKAPPVDKPGTEAFPDLRSSQQKKAQEEVITGYDFPRFENTIREYERKIGYKGIDPKGNEVHIQEGVTIPLSEYKDGVTNAVKTEYGRDARFDGAYAAFLSEKGYNTALAALTESKMMEAPNVSKYEQVKTQQQIQMREPVPAGPLLMPEATPIAAPEIASYLNHCRELVKKSKEDLYKDQEEAPNPDPNTTDKTNLDPSKGSPKIAERVKDMDVFRTALERRRQAEDSLFVLKEYERILQHTKGVQGDTPETFKERMGEIDKVKAMLQEEVNEWKKLEKQASENDHEEGIDSAMDTVVAQNPIEEVREIELPTSTLAPIDETKRTTVSKQIRYNEKTNRFEVVVNEKVVKDFETEQAAYDFMKSASDDMMQTGPENEPSAEYLAHPL